VKNVFLSVVVVATLVAAGIGGTLADFSDIEVSQDNVFKTGALDLVVSDYLGNQFQNAAGGISPMFTVRDVIPCYSNDIKLDLHNLGQGTQGNPTVYLHLKNFECGWVVPKLVYQWVDVNGDEVIVVDPPPAGTQGTGYPKPLNEPEYVGELGGLAGEDVDGNKVFVPGIGPSFGEGCELARQIHIEIRVAGPYPCDTMLTAAEVPGGDWVTLDLSEYDTDPANGIIKLNELECVEIDLGSLPYCYKIWVNFITHLQDIDEDDLIEQGVLTDPGTGYGWFDDTIPAEAKWDHWPTNAIQKDALHFDMAFELFQKPLP